MRKVKGFSALLCLCLLVLSFPVSAAEPQSAEEVTLPPLQIGIRELAQIPESWNPLETLDSDQEAILSLTSEPLYRIDADGQITPVQALALPEDVTGEFAGSYGIPDDAVRGYAFAISLREGVCWNDGKALTVSDWRFTIEKRMEQEAFPLEIANYQAYIRGETKPVEQIISLAEAGYGSVSDALAEDIQDFYVDTTNFWGLDTGWRRVTDRTRLFDAAIPSGCEEMYVTPAYLYREYLCNSGSQRLFQSEFVGVPAQQGEVLTMADVGIVEQEGRLVLILQDRATVSHVAVALSGLHPVPQGTVLDNYGTAANFRGCGQYRITSVTENEIVLAPNPYWTGQKAEFDTVRCIKAS